MNKRTTGATWVQRNKYGIHPKTLHSVAISYDEKYIITAGSDSYIHVIDMNSHLNIISMEGR